MEQPRQQPNVTLPPPPLTPEERKRLARDTLLFRVGWMIDKGYPVFVIAGQRGMPAMDKLWRWISASPDLRRRYEAAADWRRAQLADHTVAMADALGDNSRSGRRLRIAVRRCLPAR